VNYYKREVVDLVDAAGNIAMRDVIRDDLMLWDGLYLQIIVLVLFDVNGRLLVSRRAAEKAVASGQINHVCGAVKSDESPLAAAVREAREETGIVISNAVLVEQGLNAYQRYRYLFGAVIDQSPDSSGVRDSEVDWLAFRSVEDLHIAQRSGDSSFVLDFFEDLDMAAAALTGARVEN
jgi:8-oxo-dGTP pyrophosphatase MutT (NUDIX family)